MILVDFAAPSERRLGLRLYLKERTQTGRDYILQVIETQDKSPMAKKVHDAIADAGFVPGDVFGHVGLELGKKRGGWEFSTFYPFSSWQFPHQKRVPNELILASLDALGMQDLSRFPKKLLDAARARIFARSQIDLHPMLENRGLAEYILHMVTSDIEREGGKWIRHPPVNSRQPNTTRLDMAKWLKYRKIKTYKWYPISKYKEKLQGTYILRKS